MAHPIRPESYIAMDNFYTATVYNKGAEVRPGSMSSCISAITHKRVTPFTPPQCTARAPRCVGGRFLVPGQ